MTLGGIMNASAPLLRDANLVYLAYCTSDAWIGDAARPFSSLDFRFRGREYIDATLATLAADFGFGATAGTQLLWTGCSAGARGALFNTYRVAERVRAMAGANLKKFGALYDSAFWIDEPPLVASVESFMDEARGAYSAFNVSAPGVLDPACVAAHAGADAWKCLYGEYAVATVAEPFLLHSFQYDLFQLGVDEDLHGRAPQSADELAYAEGFRNNTRTAAARDVIAPAREGTAALLPACFRHCNTGGSTFTTATTNGVSLEDATVSWFSGSGAAPQFIVEDCEGLNCGHDCPKLP